MDRLIRLLLLSGCLVYFTLCIASGLEISHTLHQATIAFFLAFASIVIVRYIVLLLAAIRDKIKTPNSVTTQQSPSITIIVPAFNEENLIEAALLSLAWLDYPDYEIIVVDDGSSDGTACIAHQMAARYPLTKIRVISQSNSGKSWALNTGIVHAQGDLVVCVDSDSQLNTNALKAGARHFSDPRVGAVGGFVDVINANELITRMQQLEYIISQNFVRRALSLFNVVTVVPGPIGMFRKKAIQQVGGYSTQKDCFAEDADLTVRLLAQGWRVQGDTQMVAHTEAPNTLYSLLRQRYRWKRGLFQAFMNNIGHLLKAPNKKCIVIAGFLAFETFLFETVNFGITLFAITNFLAYAKLNVFLWALVFYCFLDLVVLLFSNLEYGHFIQKTWLLLILKISYAYILQAWGVFALLDEWLSTKMSWDKLERTGESFQG